jgi:hypothetical protein
VAGLPFVLLAMTTFTVFTFIPISGALFPPEIQPRSGAPSSTLFANYIYATMLGIFTTAIRNTLYTPLR